MPSEKLMLITRNTSLLQIIIRKLRKTLKLNFILMDSKSKQSSLANELGNEEGCFVTWLPVPLFFHPTTFHFCNELIEKHFMWHI